MNFKDETVIVTGAARGLGKAIALKFASLNANVCIVDRNEKELEEVKDIIQKNGWETSLYVCDVSDETQVQDSVSAIETKYGQISVLVNNAGLWRTSCPFIDSESQEWIRKIQVNVLGLMYFSQAALKNMIKYKYGRIINIGSVAGTYGIANMADYSATKGAVSSFTKALAKEVAEYGITVNNVTPGNVREENKENPALSYMNRSGKPEEYASLVCFLASDEASYISGQDYQIDGCRKKL